MFIMASFIFISCEKDTGNLGFDKVIGGETFIDTLTIPVISYTADVDSVLVALDYTSQLTLAGGYYSVALLGQTSDNYFGESRSAFVGQLMPNSLNTDFGDNAQIDSVFLDMRLTGSVGDTATPMGFKVYELNSDLSKDSTFYSSYSPAKGQLLGEVSNLRVKPKTPYPNAEQVSPAMLRIPLDDTYFRDKFLSIGDGDADEFSSLENFIEYFKGITIECSEGAAILYMAPQSSYSRMRIYFHNSTDTSSVSYNFSPDRSTVPIHFNTFKQDYTSAAFNLDMQDTVNGETQTFVQTMGGVVTVLKLQMPDLDSLQKEGLVINQAHLVLHQKTGTGLSYTPISQLEVRSFEDGILGSRLIDFTSTTGTNGAVEYGSFRNNKYTFNISRHIFDLTNGSDNIPLAIHPRSFATQAGKVILSGGDISGTEVKVYYTKP